MCLQIACKNKQNLYIWITIQSLSLKNYNSIETVDTSIIFLLLSDVLFDGNQFIYIHVDKKIYMFKFRLEVDGIVLHILLFRYINTQLKWI